MHGFEYQLQSTIVGTINPNNEVALFTHTRVYDTDEFCGLPGPNANIIIPEGVSTLRCTITFGSVDAVAADSVRVKAGFTVYSLNGAVYKTFSFPELPAGTTSMYSQYEFVLYDVPEGTELVISMNPKKAIEMNTVFFRGEVLAGDILLT